MTAVIGRLLLIPGASRAMADKRPEEWGFLSGDYLRDSAQRERSPRLLLPAGYNAGRFLAVWLMTVFGKHTQGSAGVILGFTWFAERRR